MKISVKLSIITCILLLATSCASDVVPEDGVKKPIPEKKIAPVKISDSLIPTNEGAFQGSTGSSITLKKSSLGATFLMSVLLSTSDNAALPQVLMPKVVSFEMNGTELALMEENVYSIYGEVPTGKLLQTFAVESQDAENITFKWNYGLSSVSTKGFYIASDAGPDASQEQISSSESVLPAVASYLKRARIKDNRLELRQVTRVRGVQSVLIDTKSEEKVTAKPIAVDTLETSVQLDISFAPYVENKRFQRRLSTKQEGVGYFEIAQVRKTEGPIDIYASRWDLHKDAGLITYAISKNTPAEALEAMKEGILYWNQVSQAALGRDIVKVETNVDPLEAPRPRTVMVYWVPYSGAGSAYANFQPDPISGEITSGLVYQTSVFYLSGKMRGRRFVNRGVENKPRVVAPIGFRSAAICNFQDPDHIGKDPLINSAMDEKISVKMATDYLRHVVAHEVGHTLGLRHNMAGSMSSELKSPDEHRQKFQEYLSDEKHPGAVTTSSVMEYSTFRDVLLEGAAIGTKKFLEYDKAAIAWGYGEEIVKADEIKAPLFCTDVEAGKDKTYGCSTKDSGLKPLAGHASGIARSRLLAADIVLESLIDGIRPENETDRVSVKRALASAHPDNIMFEAPSGLNLGSDFTHLIRLGGPGIKAIGIDREKKGANWENQKEYGEATKAFFAKEFEELGGLPGILKEAYDLDGAFKVKKGWLKEAVVAKTSAPEFGRGKDPSGKPYELSEEEKAAVKAASEKLAEGLENAFLRDLLLAVTGLLPNEVHKGSGKTSPEALTAYPKELKTWAPYVVQDSWQAPIATIGEQMALDSEGEISGTIDGNVVVVPAPKFSMEVRMAAMRLYSPKVFGGRSPPEWLAESEEKLTKAMIERLAPVLKVSETGQVQPAGKVISKELKEWATKEMAVLNAMKTSRNPPAAPSPKGD